MKRKLFTFLLLFFFFNFPDTSPVKASSSAGTLTVIISNFRNNKGSAVITLFNGENGFPKSPEKAIKILYNAINDKKSVAVFENISAGEYAISVFHDENNNKKMDTNFFGIPKEGVGASNNARGHFGPPKYNDAKFLFNGNAQTINLSVVYL